MSIKYHDDPEILSLVLFYTDGRKTTEKNHFLIEPIYELSETIDTQGRKQTPTCPKFAGRRVARANRRRAAPPLVNLTAALVELEETFRHRGEGHRAVSLRVMSWINIYIYIILM